MFACSSKRAFSSTSATTCLPRLGGLDSARTIGLVAAGPVQRLLDREHVGSSRRLLDERLDRRRERVVRMVHEHVAARGARANTSASSSPPPSAGGVSGAHGVVLELGPVERVERPQPAEVERPVDHVDVARLELELAAAAARAPRGVIVRVDLEPDRAPNSVRRSSTASIAVEEVLGFVVLELEVGVAGDPERVVRERSPCRGTTRRGARRSPARAERSAAPSGSATNRGSSGGTFTRANRSLAASRGRARRPRGSATGSRCRGTGARGRPRAA